MLPLHYTRKITLMKLSLLWEAKGPADFDYDNIAKRMWQDKLAEAKKEFKITFDTENDEPLSNRIITIPQSQWDFAKCRFKCELRSAGGDWEHPVLYFRCQLIDGYARDLTKSGDSQFCVIPKQKDGNPHLVKTKSGKFGAPNNNDISREDVEERDEPAAWKFLERHLKELVDAEIAEVKSAHGDYSKNSESEQDAVARSRRCRS